MTLLMHSNINCLECMNTFLSFASFSLGFLFWVEIALCDDDFLKFLNIFDLIAHVERQFIMASIGAFSVFSFLIVFFFL